MSYPDTILNTIAQGIPSNDRRIIVIRNTAVEPIFGDYLRAHLEVPHIEYRSLSDFLAEPQH